MNYSKAGDPRVAQHGSLLTHLTQDCVEGRLVAFCSSTREMPSRQIAQTDQNDPAVGNERNRLDAALFAPHGTLAPAIEAEG